MSGNLLRMLGKSQDFLIEKQKKKKMQTADLSLTKQLNVTVRT